MVDTKADQQVREWKEEREQVIAARRQTTDLAVLNRLNKRLQQLNRRLGE